MSDALSIVDDILGVLDSSPDEQSESSTILCILEKEETRSLMKDVDQLVSDIRFEYHEHDAAHQVDLDRYSLVVAECRLIEGLEDLKTIRKIKAKRAQLPIVILGLNDDEEYISLAYEEGASDYIALPCGPLIITRKIEYFNSLAKKLHVLELKNTEVIDMMRSLRVANQNLKEEKSVRMAVETERDFAKEAALVNQQMKEILDNLQEAFFFVGRDMKIGDSASKSCELMFDGEITHKMLGRVLNLVGQTELMMKLGLEQVFEGFMPPEVSLSLLPSKTETNSGLILEFRYTAVYGDDGEIEKIIVAASDITEIEREKVHFQKEAHQNSILLHVLQNRESFKDYIHDYKTVLDSLCREDGPAKIKRILHTLKGNSSTFKLDELAKAIHHWEDQLADEDVSDWPLEEIKFDLSDRLKKFLTKYYDILRLNYKHEEGHFFQISEDHLNRVLETLDESPAEIAVRSSKDLLNKVRLKPVHHFVAVYETSVEMLAAKLDKRIKYHRHFEGIYLHNDRFHSFFKALVHVINNACDHGVESPVERLERGKREAGNLFFRIELNESDETLCISIMDDGRGINPKIVKEKAVEKEIITLTQSVEMKDDEALELIFASGFSTAQEITDTSGRGVGMSAVKSIVEEMGGSLKIKSKVGVGTKMIFSIPLTSDEYYLDQSHANTAMNSKVA